MQSGPNPSARKRAPEPTDRTDGADCQSELSECDDLVAQIGGMPPDEFGRMQSDDSLTLDMLSAFLDMADDKRCVEPSSLCPWPKLASLPKLSVPGSLKVAAALRSVTLITTALCDS